ncbi:VPLPA-CTERM sorting domain-containing protein [uncultured Tateyamaria sp.]|uniref:VPLPA-CTERM sorting domain-containing protein n=1 Tax=uncultured Tateyamaria sp. TaxID=455651 RepID=UPI0026348017|nr:VPLPA-CTERM sorting domain-containing protein [uncultured Tateyamaria sp.]
MKKSFFLAGALIVALSTAASAATFSVIGGTAGTIPEAGQTNEVLINVFGTPSAAGYFGGQISLDMDADIEVAFFGYEAGFTNTFEITGTGGTETFSTTSGLGALYAANAATPISTATVSATSGLLNFRFTSNGVIGGNPVADAINGFNPDNVVGGASNFFASFARGDKGSVFLFFDDTGAGDDDNHDDFVVRLSVKAGGDGEPSPVPLPAGGLLLVGGLGVLAAARRRKTKS